MSNRSTTNSRFLARALAFLLPVAVLWTGVALMVYGATQHVYRTSANDPQMQIATDAVLRLDAGTSPAAVAGTQTVDLAASLSPYITIYASGRHILASTARLNGAIPSPPSAVLHAVSKKDMAENWLTWQPKANVRVAVVVMGWRKGSVLVGRSLRSIEDRENDLQVFVVGGWAAGLLALTVAAGIASILWPTSRGERA